MADVQKVSDSIGSKSSVFEKLPVDLRRRVDQAVVDRDPPAYRDLYAKFKLAEHKVSLTAFYYYARRLRAVADMAHVAELATADGPDLGEMLPMLVAYRMLDAANDEATSPRTLHRLADTWRVLVNTRFNAARQAAMLEEDQRQRQKREDGDFHKAFHEYTRFVADQRKIDDPKFKEMLARMGRGEG